MQTTHITDPETGHWEQVVSPERLREILKADGDSEERPRDFTPYDEWLLPD